MARHDRIAPFFGEGVYFAYPASPWLRGSNENMNGLLRQYLPKRTDLSVHDLASLARIEDRLNGRPRKRLGWASPTDAFTAALAGS
jgi:transposase, IS30 family